MFADTLVKPVNPYKQAAKQIQLNGKVQLCQFERFKHMLLDTEGHVAVNLQYALDDHKRCIVKGILETEVNVSCQRCLLPLSYRICAKVSLAVVSSEAQLEHIPNEYEGVLADNEERFLLLPTLEDELILALPVVASHEEGSCKMPVYERADSQEECAKEVDNNPFDVLKSLKFDDRM